MSLPRRLWDALGLGIRALMWSGEIAAQEEGKDKVEFGGPVAWTTSLLSASAEQQRGPMNVPFITAISISRMLGKILTAPDSAACEDSALSVPRPASPPRRNHSRRVTPPLGFRSSHRKRNTEAGPRFGQGANP